MGDIRYTGVSVIGLLVAVLMLFATCPPCGAQPAWTRSDKSDIYIFGQSMGGDETKGQGVTLEFDDTIVGGIGFGHNFSEFLNFNAEAYYGNMDMTAKGYGSSIGGDTDLLGLNANMDIYFLKDRLTPMIGGGIGMIRFDGQYRTLYGEVTFDESDFSYNVFGGFRWDAANDIMIKGFYRATWTTLEDTDDAVMFDGFNVSIGFLF